MRNVIRTYLLVALLCGVGLAWSAPAGAQGDGVFVDPDTPAGKEYGVPLEEARRDTGGGDGGATAGGGNTGGGTGPTDDAGATPGSKKGDATTYNSGLFGSGIEKGADPTGSTPTASATPGTDDGGFSGPVLTAGIALAVLLGGGLLGLSLRRRFSSA